MSGVELQAKLVLCGDPAAGMDRLGCQVAEQGKAYSPWHCTVLY